MPENHLVHGLDFDMQGSEAVEEFHTEKHPLVRTVSILLLITY
jgi:hypothetical protein